MSQELADAQKALDAKNAKIASLRRIPIEAWADVALYWLEQIEEMLDEQGSPTTPPQRKLELAAQIYMARHFRDFPATVKDELAVLESED
jgi:hypothetical protein